MKYVLAILLPPVGLLSVGKGGQALLCLILWITIIGWPLAALPPLTAAPRRYIQCVYAMGKFEQTYSGRIGRAVKLISQARDPLRHSNAGREIHHTAGAMADIP